jgi:putative ABC transport system permease protein
LTRADAEAIGKLSGIAAIAPETGGSAQVRYLSNNMSTNVSGVTGDYLQVRALTIGAGLAITDADDRARQRVAVIGANVSRTLFGTQSAIGERIQIQGTAFRVIGVLSAKGDAGFTSPDDLVLVPLATHQGVLFGQDYLTSLSVQVVREDLTDATVTRISELLRLRHGLAVGAEDDFDVRSQTEMLATMGAITGTFTSLLGGVAAVSLLVGGIGIMNIMLVSVQERTREVGVRMAVGARRRDILLQFLVEAIVVSLAGGVVGIGFGYGIARAVASVSGWQTIVPPYAIVLSACVSIAVGLIFGVGPARRASHMNPVEALRQE